MLSHAGCNLDRKQGNTDIFNLDMQSQQSFRSFWRQGTRKTGTKQMLEQLEVLLPLSQDEHLKKGSNISVFFSYLPMNKGM